MRSSFSAAESRRQPHPPPKLVTDVQRKRHIASVVRFKHNKGRVYTKQQQSLVSNSVSERDNNVSVPTNKNPGMSGIGNLRNWLEPSGQFWQEIQYASTSQSVNDQQQSKESEALAETEDEKVNEGTELPKFSFAQAVLVSARIKETMAKLQQKKVKAKQLKDEARNDSEAAKEILTMDTTYDHEILSGHTQGVRVVKVFHAFLLSASEDGTIGVWNLSSNKQVDSLSGHQDQVVDLDTSGNWIVSGSRDASVFVWLFSPSSGHFQLIHRFYGHDTSIIRVGFFDLRSFFSVSQCGTIRAWNTATGACMFGMNNQNDRESISTCTHFKLGDRTVLMTGGNVEGKEVKLWDLNSHRVLCTLSGHEGPVTCVLGGLFPGDVIVSGSNDCSALVWKVKLDTIPSGQAEGISPVVVSQSQRHAHSQGIQAEVLTSLKHDGPVTCLCPSPTYKQCVITGCMDGYLRVFNIQTGNVMHVLPGHNSWVLGIQIEGNLAVSCSFDQTVRTWDLRSLDVQRESDPSFEELHAEGLARQQEVFIGHEAAVYRIGYSLGSPVIDTATGKQHVKVYSCSADRTVRKWVLFRPNKQRVASSKRTKKTTIMF